MLAGCAHLPDATIGYYLPKSSTTITVVQTITCDVAKKSHATLALTVTPVYTADTDDNDPPKIKIKALDGALADTDVDATYTADGRLKGINTSQTGQAGTVIKDIVTTAATLAASGASVKPTWCNSDVAKSLGKTDKSTDADGPQDPNKSDIKPVTITYTSGALSYSKLVVGKDADIVLQADQASNALYETVKSGYSEATLMPKVTAHAAKDVQTVTEAPDTAAVPVVLPNMKKVVLELLWGKDIDLHPVSVTTYELFLPSEESDKAKRTFVLHIPPSAMFGSQKFVLGLADSGAISEIHYVKTTGAAAALEAGQSIISPLRPSQEDQANAIKAKTDIKYQQQRQAACDADPSVENCK